MPPNDQEPRYRLVDSNGNVVGSLFVNGDGNVAIQDETATETEFTPQGVATPSVETDAVRTETIGAGDYHYTADYPGADADARLDNALSAAVDGDVICLENAIYDEGHTVSTRVRLVSYANGGARFDSPITVNSRSLLDGLRIATTVTLNDNAGGVSNCVLFGGSIDVAGSQNILNGIIGGSATFQSGTSANIIDGSSSVTVTDNGSNTIGDIA
jgi:hypothetical protein